MILEKQRKLQNRNLLSNPVIINKNDVSWYPVTNKEYGELGPKGLFWGGGQRKVGFGRDKCRAVKDECKLSRMKRDSSKKEGANLHFKIFL